jgi:hypothetical protein
MDGAKVYYIKKLQKLIETIQMFRESRGYFCEIALFTSHTVLKSTIRVLTLRVWPFLFLAAFWASVQTGIIQVDCKDAN